MAVTTPEFHIGALGEENIAERRMTGVGRAGQQCVVAADLAREQHRVAVEGNERVFDAGKGLEIGGFRHTDGRTVEILAPDNIVGAFDLDKARIVGINRHKRSPFSFTKGILSLSKSQWMPSALRPR